MDLTASDTTVTLTTLVPDTVYRNETSPKLQQFTTDGKSLGWVSCNRGLNVRPIRSSSRAAGTEADNVS
jgi:hypothetical protein